MSGNKRNHEQAAGWDSARKAAAALKPAAARVRPLARSAQVATRRQVRRTRAWAAPQVESSGQILQDGGLGHAGSGYLGWES